MSKITSTLPTVLAASLLILIGNVAALETENIFGNWPGIGEKVKYQVSIQNEKYHECGGTLIAPDLVLSAAHCFFNKETHFHYNKPYFVVAGTLNTSDHTYRRPVKTIYIHSKYQNDNNTPILNDIALLRLSKGFDVGKNLPINLASLPDKDERFMGMIAKVVGFGDKDMNTVPNHFSREQLKVGYVNIVHPKQCQTEKYPTVLCATMQNGGICDADSGGSLVLRNKVIGVVSRGAGLCSNIGYPSSYTKVSKYLDFINSISHNKLTCDVIIRNNVFAILDMPVEKWTVSTKPDTEIKLLEQIQDLQLKLKESRNKNLTLKELLYESEQNYKQLEKPTDGKLNQDVFSAAYNEYLTKFNELKTQLDATKDLQISLNDKINYYNAFLNAELVGDCTRN